MTETTYGGLVYSGSSINISGDSSVAITSSDVSSNVNKKVILGGVFCVSGDLTIDISEDVNFSNNRAAGLDNVQGGFAFVSGDFSLTNAVGDILINNNHIESKKRQTQAAPFLLTETFPLKQDQATFSSQITRLPATERPPTAALWPPGI